MKEKMEKVEIEEIRFEDNDDIVTLSSVTGGGDGMVEE